MLTSRCSHVNTFSSFVICNIVFLITQLLLEYLLFYNVVTKFCVYLCSEVLRP